MADIDWRDLEAIKRLKCDDGVWRIAKTGYRRTYEEMMPRKSIEGLTLTESRWQEKGSQRS